MPQDAEPPSSGKPENTADHGGLFSTLIRKFVKPKSNGHHLREALEEIIHEIEDVDDTQDEVSAHERVLITNVLKMRNLTVIDVMIPRADIVSIEHDATPEEMMALLAEKQVSRIPVYRETLDDVIGTIHIKDILACVAAGRPVRLNDLIRDVPIVSPAMPVTDLLLMMKQNRKHLVMVVDEFGGIDGMATIGDIIEAVLGEVDDEFDKEEQPQMMERPDGTLLADARLDIEQFEEKVGAILSADEREDVDTLGGLIFSIAGRVPARGEVIKHESGIIFEIIDADPRRVNTLRIKNIPKAA